MLRHKANALSKQSASTRSTQIKLRKEKEEKVLDVGNKDWFKGLEIEVTNTSDKPIYFLSLNVEMPELPAQNSGAIKIFPLRYGRADFYEPDTKPAPDDVPIQPKATYTFIVDEKNRSGYQEWRAKDNRNDPLKLELSINFLSFGDGTGFTSMSAVPFPVKQPPEELGRCLPRPLWCTTTETQRAQELISFRIHDVSGINQ